MTAFFTAAELAALRSKGSVRYVLLAHLQFKTAGSLRLLNGPGVLDAGGFEWRGLGLIAQIEGLGDSRGTTSNPVTLTLSGVSEEVLPLALKDTDEVDQQPISIFMQMLDADEQPIGRLIGLFFGLMQPPEINRTAPQDGDGPTCTVTMTAENFMIGKSKPPCGRYTDRDQQALSPGDRFLERVAENKSKLVIWPDF